MELIMLLDKQVIDSMHINPVMLLSPEFLCDLQEELMKRNAYRFTPLKEKPQFAIDGVPSKMVFFKTASLIN